MAFDQVSLFLCPPRWKRQSAADWRTKTFSGEPVRIVSTVRAEDCEGSVVQMDELGGWFRSKGFEVIDRSPDYAVFHSPTMIQTPFGRRTEIDAGVTADGGEVSSLFCRFQLSRDTSVRLERWEAFMNELCGRFKLRIGVADDEYMGPEEFLTVVRGSDNWRSFVQE